MGTSRNAAEFSRKITKMATITQTRQRQTLEQGALLGKQIVLAEAAANGVTPSSKIAKGRWGVRYDIRGFNNPAALLRIYGPFHLVDRPTKPHMIGPRRRGRRSSGKKAIAFNGIVRRFVQHPGTRGKRIWPASVKKIERAVPTVMARRVSGGWREALR